MTISVRRGRRLVPTLLFLFLALAGASFTQHVSAAAASSPNFDYVVTIFLENKGINDTYNCGGNCTYITSLANTYGLAESYSALTHPSMANYIGMTSGG